MLSSLKNRNVRAAVISHRQLKDLRSSTYSLFFRKYNYEHQKTSSYMQRQKTTSKINIKI